MFRFIFFDLLALITVAGGGWVIWQAYERKRLVSALKYEAYFSGGPLHGQKERLAKLPATYKFTHNEPALVRRSEDGSSETVDSFLDAIYEHRGNGVYYYKGSVPVVLQYEWPNELR